MHRKILRTNVRTSNDPSLSGNGAQINSWPDCPCYYRPLYLSSFQKEEAITPVIQNLMCFPPLPTTQPKTVMLFFLIISCRLMWCCPLTLGHFCKQTSDFGNQCDARRYHFETKFNQIKKVYIQVVQGMTTPLTSVISVKYAFLFLGRSSCGF